MTGAIVTSSGEQHRGFHQSPNVLRDKYMPKIGGDGYGFVNYLVSWSNTETTLSVRRMKRDLNWSQDKLERVTALVLTHCSHFISMTPGDRVTANHWHLDMEKVWLENIVHLAKGASERLAQQATPKTEDSRGRLEKGVPEIGTYKEHSLKTKKRGVRNGTGKPHEGPPLSAPVVELGSLERSSSKNEKQPPTPEGLRSSSIFGASLTSLVVIPQVEASQPDGTANAVGQGLSVDLQDSAKPLVGMNEQATSLEKVPGGAAAGAGLAKEPSGAGNGAGRAGVDSIQPLDAQELASRPVEPVDGPAYLALRSLLGKKNLPELVKELTRTGGLPRDPWLKLTEGEIGLVRVLAQEEAKLTGANTLTLAVRGLDRLIGAVRVEKSASAKLAAAQVDPQLLTGQRCRVDAPDGTWVLGVVQEVHEVQYRILLDDQGVRKIDRTSVAELRTLRASDAPAPTVAATPAPEGPALFAPVGTSWRRVAGKGGQLGEVVTVQGVLGTKRKLSNGGELAFYTIQKDFEQVLA